MKYKELSANTVPFINCRCKLTKVLAGAARGEKGSKGEAGRVRLLDVEINQSTLKMGRTLSENLFLGECTFQ